jgi:hypothetical protein
MSRIQSGVILAATLALAVAGGGSSHAQTPPGDPCSEPGSAANVDCLRLNEIQVVGSHNSYHIEPDPILFNLIFQFDPAAIELQYTHLPLDEQFEFQGVRQIELDVFADPLGGLYAEPVGLKFILQDGTARIPELDPPGTKVLHIQHVDYETTCQFLVECLQVVKDWSDANPRHFPLMILVEAKDDPITLPAIFDIFPQFDPIPYGPDEFDALDAEIRSVFPPDQLITPDDVRGSRATLEDAILLDGWPTLGESRGKILFALDNGGSKRTDYLAGHPSLAGRVMFADSRPGDPEAGFAKLNDPFADQTLIQQLVSGGMIVRTRADAGTLEARDGDTSRREAALASGAQYVSTDYPGPESNPFGTGYFVEFASGLPARCNPISAPAECDSAALDDQALSVAVDVKPGGCPNAYNRAGRGVLPVAVVGTESLEVAQIDLSSVRLCLPGEDPDDPDAACLAPREGPPGPHSVVDDVASPFAGDPEGSECACHGLEGDGTPDLLLKFGTDDLVAALALDELSDGDLVPLVVSGALLDGTPFEGSDCVRLVPPGVPPSLLAIQSNAAEAWIDATPVDEQLDAGGFADFERTYPESTEVLLTASPTHAGRAFLGWRADGGPLVPVESIDVLVSGHIQTLEAVYADPPRRRCGLGFELVLLLPPLLWVHKRRKHRLA